MLKHVVLIFFPFFLFGQTENIDDQRTHPVQNARENERESILIKLDSLGRVGQWQQALELTNEAIENDSMFWQAYFMRGDFKTRIDPNDTSCLADYRKVIEIDSENVQVHYMLAYTYDGYNYQPDNLDKTMGIKYDTAIYKLSDKYNAKVIYHLEEVLRLDSSFLYSIRNQLRDFYEMNGQHDKAIRIMKTAYYPSNQTDSENVPIHSDAYYFPIASLLDTVNIRDAESTDYYQIEEMAHNSNRFYSRNLWALKEPLLYKGDMKSEVYRFTWLRIFSYPVSVRLEKTDEGIYVFSKLANGASGYSPGDLVVNERKEITPKTYKTFVKMIKDCDFWEMTPIENNNGKPLNDRAHWILEGRKKGVYHMVDRHSIRNLKFEEACKNLLQLSEIDLSKLY